ncbi:hypothetical protein Kpol_530p14 [Vanderwaltozyma polyspora DSM 70294]|uniref:Ribonuclease T2-like n=1 Tax=Vanderwaltozyma polyspora (strain ATCC 22028 / DSM 70294 / BCRC 21397 / CBS 2163 / NBRC 10782 / NRRL Y-8283 / UCD 57-17) TaxID=436907 RepID=A7TKY8_VANPO|nr:uncharacterized protein Kpol_530p14 [Vanderwaltozyma polyspora DSM 70294]EDO17044.1 hypothetical protein Kpol_530p14 [Vanderwaltozyma polyspora DSM 70294]
MILRDFAQFLLAFPNLNVNQDSFGLEPYSNDKCPIDIPLTCRNQTTIGDTCCFEYPGGVFLQTQFWNYRPSKKDLDRDGIENELGPLESFTIHGLWPDNCDGGFEQFCRSDLAIDDVDYLLRSDQFNNKTNLDISGEELLFELNKLWKSNNGNHESLWIHEFNKHGTCIKTIRPDCYSRWGQLDSSNDEDKKQAVYDYFRIAYKLFKKLDTFEFLKESGIVPSVNKTYTREEIQKALQKKFNGNNVYIGCDNRNALNEIWYFNLLKGSLLSEEFIPIPSFKSFGRCKADGIKFYPKGHIPTTGGGGGGGNNDGPSMRGIIRLSGYEGHLIRNGHWTIKGTEANFQLMKAPFGSYYLKSRNGYCTVADSNLLVCNKNRNTAGQFEYDDKTGYLSYSENLNWSSNEYPRGNKQSLVYHGASDNKYQFKLKFIKI